MKINLTIRRLFTQNPLSHYHVYTVLKTNAHYQLSHLPGFEYKILNYYHIYPV